MEELLNWMEYIEDVRQVRKVRHKLKDILVIQTCFYQTHQTVPDIHRRSQSVLPRQV